MKTSSVKIPKKIVSLSWYMYIIILLIPCLLLSGAFFSLSIVQGVKDTLKKHHSLNYHSHITLNSIHFTPQTEKQLDVWWQSSLSGVDSLASFQYVRAITKRSSLSAWHTVSRTPFRLVIIENNDREVFNNFINNDKDLSIPSNQVFIGQSLARQLAASLGNTIDITIPSLNYILSNVSIGNIFTAPDHFLDHYTMYINKSSLQDVLDTRFQNYHIRFQATPFISLAESDINPTIGSFNRKYTDDFLNYAYKQLNSIKKHIHSWIYFIYFLCGLIFFLSRYFSYYFNQEKLDQYIYRTGFIDAISVNKFIIFGIIKQLILCTVVSVGVIIVLNQLNLEFSSSIFINPESLYPNHGIPLPYKFSISFPWDVVIPVIPLGLLIGIIACGAFLFIYYILPNFSNPKNIASYIIIGLFIVMMFGFFTSNEFIFDNFAKQTRQKYWRQHFYGTHTLTEPRYHEYNSLNLTPDFITISPDLFNIFEDKNANYLASYETYGTLASVTNMPNDDIAPAYKYRDVSVRSLQGHWIQFSNIIAPLQSNQVVVGKNIGEYLSGSALAQLILENSTGEKNESPLIVSHIMDLPCGDFNNSVFINHSNLSVLLNQDASRLTKLQTIGHVNTLKNYTNSKTILRSLSENTKYWNYPSHLIWYVSLIRVLLQATACLLLVFGTMFHLYIKNKKTLINYYILGMPFEPLKKYSLLILGGFSIGSILSWIVYVPTVLQDRALPEFLQIDFLTPEKLAFSLEWTSIPILMIGYTCIVYIYYVFFSYILKVFQKKIITSINRNHFS